MPDLASAATVANPSTLDITIRPGLVYSNGTPLNAAAVKAGFERNLTNPHSGVWDQSMSDISSIDVTGTDSLVMDFSQPVASTFYPLLADQESFMALPTGPSSANPNENVVGAGPFILKSYVEGEKIVLVKNPRYWDAKAIDLSGITFVNVPTGPQQLTSLESGLVAGRGHPRQRHPGLECPVQPAVQLAVPRRQLLLRPHLQSLGTAGQRQGPPGPQLRHQPDGHQQRRSSSGRANRPGASSRPRRPSTTHR